MNNVPLRIDPQVRKIVLLSAAAECRKAGYAISAIRNANNEDYDTYIAEMNGIKKAEDAILALIDSLCPDAKSECGQDIEEFNKNYEEARVWGKEVTSKE
jgi:hypothetical protein